jgi:hypothetical protein
MTPDMLLCLIEEEDFDPEEIERLATGEFEFSVGGGVTLVVEPTGRRLGGFGYTEYRCTRYQATKDGGLDRTQQ